MRAFTLVAALAAARASEDCEVIDLPGSLKLDFSTSELLWNNLGGLGPNDCGTRSVGGALRVGGARALAAVLLPLPPLPAVLALLRQAWEGEALRLPGARPADEAGRGGVPGVRAGEG